jgi:hypothetical protein
MFDNKGENYTWEAIISTSKLYNLSDEHLIKIQTGIYARISENTGIKAGRNTRPVTKTYFLFLI